MRPMLQFHKTKAQEWVVLGPVDEVRMGLATVSKKDGGTSEVEIIRLGNPFEKDGQQVRYGYVLNAQKQKSARSPRANAYFAQLRKDEEAAKAGHVRYCDLCGEEAQVIGRDKAGKLGDLCGDCGEMDEGERVFS